MAHTPGPWKLESESRSPDGSDLLVTTADGAYSIADCRDESTGVRDTEEAEANARLIAAAPALLDALRDVLAVASVRIDDPRIVQFDAAHAAVALAEGKS